MAMNSNQKSLLTDDSMISLDCDDKLIELTYDEISDLLNEFDPEFDNFKSIVMNILHSPFDEQYITDLVDKWYNSRVHHNQDTVQSFSQYYSHELNNKWFFSIIKHLDTDRRKYWLDKIKKKRKIEILK